MADFLPKQDAKLLAWSEHFLAVLESTAGSFGVPGDQVAAYRVLHDAFAQAMLANDPTSRSRVTVATKTAAMKQLKADARQLAKLVNGNAAITPAERVQLGLNPGIRVAPKLPVPPERPSVQIVDARGTSVTVKLTDLSIARRGRPPGIAGAVVIAHVGIEAVPISRWSFAGTISGDTLQIDFPLDTPTGTPVHVTACWLNPRLQRGPWADAAMVRLPGANVGLWAGVVHRGDEGLQNRAA